MLRIMNTEITWGYFCNKVIYCSSTTMTHFSLPCFSENLPVLSLLKNSFTCSVKWGGQGFLGLGHFFKELPVLVCDTGSSVWDCWKQQGNLFLCCWTSCAFWEKLTMVSFPDPLFLKLQLPVLFVSTSCAIFPAVSSVKIPKWENSWKGQKQSRKSWPEQAPAELPCFEWNGTKTWRCTVKFGHLSREKSLRLI